ncbi:hypothetical protein [Veronia pacifica]|uniref:Uncharacterized protein n=1 Tax=Veronia pacifica TaxID=1080227 RepID=A0A1C3EE68_9GAMM|nr:hypothetical protein [Veronia pacifica]ODA31552.1 hypothetical protein A8L45_16195 [Veronia pacifica]
MLSKHRDYLLQDTKHMRAHFQVNPTGIVEVEIIDNKEYHSAEFDKVKFERRGKVTKLVGQTVSGNKKVQWQVPLAIEDANELAQLIEDASEELEILMRDL